MSPRAAPQHAGVAIPEEKPMVRIGSVVIDCRDFDAMRRF